MLNVTERDIMLNIFLFSTVPLCFLSIKTRMSLGVLTSDAVQAEGRSQRSGGGVAILSQNDVVLNYYYYYYLQLCL